jgi:hypothetical protein
MLSVTLPEHAPHAETLKELFGHSTAKIFIEPLTAIGYTQKSAVYRYRVAVGSGLNPAWEPLLRGILCLSASRTQGIVFEWEEIVWLSGAPCTEEEQQAALHNLLLYIACFWLYEATRQACLAGTVTPRWEELDA